MQQATNLYVALGLEETVAYYNTKESVDASGTSSSSMRTTIVAHANPDLVGKPSPRLWDPTPTPPGPPSPPPPTRTAPGSTTPMPIPPLALWRPSTPGW